MQAANREHATQMVEAEQGNKRFQTQYQKMHLHILMHVGW
jgi:hypothetical protein